MRINIYAEGFQVTPALRAFVDLRLLSAFGPFCDRIESAVVRLRASNDRTAPDTTSCDVVVRLHPSGEVRAHAQEPRLDEAIDRASKEIAVSVENAVSQPQRISVPFRIMEKAIGHGAVECVLHGNGISQHQREMLEIPEKDLRPVSGREYWRPPGAEDDERHEERGLCGDHRVIAGRESKVLHGDAGPPSDRSASGPSVSS